jgi:hypothetical protein
MVGTRCALNADTTSTGGGCDDPSTARFSTFLFEVVLKAQLVSCLSVDEVRPTSVVLTHKHGEPAQNDTSQLKLPKPSSFRRASGWTCHEDWKADTPLDLGATAVLPRRRCPATVFRLASS